MCLRTQFPDSGSPFFVKTAKSLYPSAGAGTERKHVVPRLAWGTGSADT